MLVLLRAAGAAAGGVPVLRLRESSKRSADVAMKVGLALAMLLGLGEAAEEQHDYCVIGAGLAGV